MKTTSRLALGLACCAVLPAWASHPLITEDTDVQGRGKWALELHGERTRDRENGVASRNTEVLAKLAYGITEKADLEVELPYLREVEDGAVAEGRGDASVSLKWRFYESNGWSLVLKPDLFLPTGRDELGLGAGRTRWAANLIGGYEAGRFEFLAQLGYTDNRNRIDERSALRHASTAVLYAITEKMKLLADYARLTEPDPERGSHARLLVLGAKYEASERIELGLGLQLGLNDTADDRALRAGVKLHW